MPGETFLELDVRPLFAAKQAPLPAILNAVHSLAPGQALRLIAPIEPVPLYQMLAGMGFSHESARRADGAWVIAFRR